MSGAARLPGRVVLVRHGQTEWSAAGRQTGLTDLPLDDVGRRQAQALKPLLTALSFAQVWSSPLQRARSTAQLAGFRQVSTDPQLAEWDYGDYDGLTVDEIDARLGRPWSLWKDGVVPGDTPGETLQQVRSRCDRVVTRILPVVLRGATVALVAHGHLLRVLATAWLDTDAEVGALLALGPATVSTLTFERTQRVIGTWNATPDLLQS